MSRMRVTLQVEIDTIQANLVEEGELVLRALRGAMEALEKRDPELADEVIAFDDEVDRQYVGIQEGIASVLARQAPAAGDLRLVLGMLHANLHLERMADYCVTIAKLTKLSSQLSGVRKESTTFSVLGPYREDGFYLAPETLVPGEEAVVTRRLGEVLGGLPPIDTLDARPPT